MKDLRVFLIGYFFPGVCIPNTSSIHEIFEAITHNKLWDYWNYYPLEKLIQVFVANDQETTSWIKSYKQDLVSYKVTMKLIDHIGATNYDFTAKSNELPSEEEKQLEKLARYDQQYYKALSFKLKMKVTDQSLQYIDNLWDEFAILYSLPPYVAVLDCVHEGCVLIVWLIPSHLTPQILSATPRIGSFYHKHEITRVELDGKCIYQDHHEVYTYTVDKS